MSYYGTQLCTINCMKAVMHLNTITITNILKYTFQWHSSQSVDACDSEIELTEAAQSVMKSDTDFYWDISYETELMAEHYSWFGVIFYTLMVLFMSSIGRKNLHLCRFTRCYIMSFNLDGCYWSAVAQEQPDVFQIDHIGFILASTRSFTRMVPG